MFIDGLGDNVHSQPVELGEGGVVVGSRPSIARPPSHGGRVGTRYECLEGFN